MANLASISMCYVGLAWMCCVCIRAATGWTRGIGFVVCQQQHTGVNTCCLANIIDMDSFFLIDGLCAAQIAGNAAAVLQQPQLSSPCL